jgi:hypothetical protein
MIHLSTSNSSNRSSPAARSVNGSRIVARTRAQAIALLTRRIDFHYWPRFSAFMIACATAAFGLLFSAILWRVGVESMTWRFPIAVMLSYGVLLLLLYSWSKRDWWDWGDPNLWPSQSGSHSGHGGSGGCESPMYSGSGGNFGGAGASESFDAVSDGGGSLASDGTGSLVSDTADSVASDALSVGFEAAVSADEGVVITIPLFLIFVLLLCFGGFAFGLVSLIWSAPTLLAHLMIDAGTAGLLMVYVSPGQREHWLATAFRKTLPGFLVLAILLTFAGYAFEWFDPSAITIFDVWANRETR